MSIPVTDPFVRAYLDRLDRCAAVLPITSALNWSRRSAGILPTRWRSARCTPRRICAPCSTGSASRKRSLRPRAPMRARCRDSRSRRPASAGRRGTARADHDMGRHHGRIADRRVDRPGHRLAGRRRDALDVTRWRPGEKVLGTLIVPLGPAAVLWFALIPVSSESCTSGTGTLSSDGTMTTVPQVCTHSGLILSAWVGIPLILFWLIAPIVVAVVLFKRAAARAAREPPVPITIEQLGAARWRGLEIAAVLLLSVGTFVVPIIAPITGLALAWTSDAGPAPKKSSRRHCRSARFSSACSPFSSWWRRDQERSLPYDRSELAMPTITLVGPMFLLAAAGPFFAAVYLAVRLNSRRKL